MQTLKSFLDQTLLIWKDSTAAARFGLALLFVICVGSVIGVGIWSSQPHYVTLASELDPEKATKVIDALEAANISYKLQGSGTVLVDQQKRARAQIAIGKLGIGKTNSNLEEVTPWMDPLNQQNIFRRNQERQLEMTIQNLDSINSVNVHLSIPEKQAFIRENNTPSASVVLEISSHAQFDESGAASIASVVANAVPGLTIDRVSITDTQGNKYATDESIARLSKKEEFRVARDRELSQKVETILSGRLGFGNAIVEVTTDFSFPEETLIKTEYNKDGKVVNDETISSTTTTGQNLSSAGAAGAASNVGGSTGDSSSKTIITKTEDLTSKYDVPSTIRNSNINTPVLNLMTVAVAINSTAVEDENKQITPEIKASLESLVRQAVGFRDGTDSMSVEFFEFVDPLPMDVPATLALPWSKINQVLKNLSLGLAAVVALFVALKALKKIQPDPATSSELADRTAQVNQLSELVKQNPEVFSKIIESWSSLESTGRNSESQNKKAA